jgi:hypothetical protein
VADDGVLTPMWVIFSFCAVRYPLSVDQKAAAFAVLALFCAVEGPVSFEELSGVAADAAADASLILFICAEGVLVVSVPVASDPAADALLILFRCAEGVLVVSVPVAVSTVPLDVAAAVFE